MELENFDENGYLSFRLKKEPEYIGYYPNVKFFFDNKKFFFKSRSYGAIVEGELIARKLGEKLGLDVLPVKPAVYNFKNTKYYGIISKNFVKKDCIEVPTNRLRGIGIDEWSCTYKTITDTIEKFVAEENCYTIGKKVKIDKSFYKDVQNLIFFDFITFQADRAPRNISFILEPKDGDWVVKMAPIFDNSWILGFDELFFTQNAKKKDVSNYFALEETFDFALSTLKYHTAYTKAPSYKIATKTIQTKLLRNQNYQDLAKKALSIDIVECIKEIENENPKFYFAEMYKQTAIIAWKKSMETLSDLMKEADCDFDDEEIMKNITDFTK